MKDLYKILKVKKDATPQEIKKSYHKLAQQYHPDRTKVKDDSMFKEAAAAYAILSDPAKRKRYDNGENPDNIHNGQSNEDAVRSNLTRLFIQIITKAQGEYEYVDLVKEMCLEIDALIALAEQALKRTKEEIKKFKRIDKRISGKDDFFNVVINQQVAGLQQEVVNHEKQLNLMKLANEELAEYKYDTKERKMNNNDLIAALGGNPRIRFTSRGASPW